MYSIPKIMSKYFYLIGITILLFSCDKRKSDLEMKISTGYWFTYWEPQNQLNNENFIRVSCVKFDIDNIEKVYHFNMNGSVDTTNNTRDTQFDIRWKYSSLDSTLTFGDGSKLRFKLVRHTTDTIVLVFKNDFPPYKKNNIVCFVKYIPRSVPILVGDSVIRFKKKVNL
jgi:hypothetical protein